MTNSELESLAAALAAAREDAFNSAIAACRALALPPREYEFENLTIKEAVEACIAAIEKRRTRDEIYS